MLSDRCQLRNPNPDLTYGIKVEHNRSLKTALRAWQDNSRSSVDLFVRDYMALPFILFQSKSIDGSEETARSQIANAAIRAHDCLCSMDAQEKLVVFGITQVGTCASFYVILSTQRTILEQPCCNQVRSHIPRDHVLMVDLYGTCSCLHS